MKKIFLFICMLVMVSISICGCGKLSDKELYNRATSMQYGISYDDIVDTLGKPSKIDNEMKLNRTGEIISGSYVWSVEGMEDGWLQVGIGTPLKFAKLGYTSLQVSRDLARKMAEDNKRIYNGEFNSNLGRQVEMDIAYNNLTYYGLVEILGVEGTVIKKSVYPENIDSNDNRPEITYIWFDVEGNSFTAKFKNDKAYIVQRKDVKYPGSGKNSKLSSVELYNKAIEMSYKTSYDDLVDELDKPTKVVYEFENSKTGAINSGCYLWGVDGMDHGWIEINTGRAHNFSKVGYYSLEVSRDLALKVAKETNLISDKIFSKKMTYRLKRSLSGKKLTYNQLKTLMNCEGVVLKKHAGFTRYEPTTTYIWFDKQGNSFDATAYDK